MNKADLISAVAAEAGLSKSRRKKKQLKLSFQL